MIEDDLIAHPDCLVVYGLTEEFYKYIGDETITVVQSHSDLLHCLKNIPLFKNFSRAKLEKLASVVKYQVYNPNEIIIKQGEISNGFYILKRGKIDIQINNKYIRTLNENEFLGERSLFVNEKRSATAISVGLSEVYLIEKNNFSSLLESNLKEYLLNRIFLQDDSITIDDLNFVKELGVGSYGSVSLVQNKKTKYFYAIKAMSLSKIHNEKLHSYITLERSILLKIDHPFIMKLVKTMKDSSNIYFLTEHIRGKDLFEVIRDIGILNKKQASFFAASMVIAVNYLHERNIVHRDIKPENILVTENGFLKLIDFGTAKDIEDRTTTIIGTPYYMAPEVLLGEGYSFSVDYWSIAICIYEFICGGLPYELTTEDPMDMYIAIIKNEIIFPNFVKDLHLVNLVSSMMNKSYRERLCNMFQIKNHVYFYGFDWDALNEMNINPPYIPKIVVNDVKSTRSYNNYIQNQSGNLGKINIKGFDKWLEDF
jgi:cGMP-dependent protein kinase